MGEAVHDHRAFERVEVTMTFVTKAPAAALVFLCGMAGASAAQPAEPSGVKFELRQAESKPAEGLTEATVAGTNDKVYLHKAAALTGQDIAQARATTDGRDKPAVEITLTEEGRKTLAKLTEGHQGKPLAIIVAGKVISAPIVRSKIDGDKVLVSGSFTKDEVERIAKGIKGK
jgi:preprotein translocase subunit SecD